MRLQVRKGTVDGYEWRCRNQSKDNLHDVVRSKCKAEIGKPSTYEVNTRLVYAMRCLGKGAETARMFCGIMNLPHLPTNFSKYNKVLLGATKDVCDATMKDAVKEAVQENQNIRDV
ncbi:uncharacterized protein TNCV_215451 [Trichonephila clavipes]|nr:uncharacterized protein TNCV_215451 [Trichonephila clavipes]